jgi:hypothetical protein
VYKGRKPSIDQAQVEKLKADGLGAGEIAKRLNIGVASGVSGVSNRLALRVAEKGGPP